MQFSKIIKHFNQLSNQELYAIIRLRNEVFVVEQNCIFQDADGKDQFAYHLMLQENDELIAYARILPAGVSYQEISVGRVVTHVKARGNGAGKTLMQAALAFIFEKYGHSKIRIGAQFYLRSFYNSLGFVDVGEIYLEDGIEHIEMTANV